MSYAQLLWPFFLVLVLWAVLKRLSRAKSPLAHVPGPPKDHWLKGNFHQIFSNDGWDYNLQLAEKYGGAVKIHAMLGEELLYVSDPRALQHIIMKEQYVYEETEVFVTLNLMLFGEGLLSRTGEQHKRQRKMLNPVFSLANMRELLPIIQPIANKLRSVLLTQLPPDGGDKEIDIMHWMSRGALEYICQAGLGYSFHSLDASNEYTEAVRMLGPTAFSLVLLSPFMPFIIRNIPLFWRNKLIAWLPIKRLKAMQRIVGIMDNTSRRIFDEKRVALEQAQQATSNQIVEKVDVTGAEATAQDIMSILLRANAAASDDDRLTEKELLGQMNTLIFAGYETTTSALCRILHILAERPDAQSRLRSEISNAKREYMASKSDSWNEDDTRGKERWEDVELPYDVLMGLPYLDAICRETLRMHPPVSMSSRTTRLPTVLPLQYPMRSDSGVEIHSIPLPAKTNIFISILAANRNKKVWGDDADVWIPERWLTSSGQRVGVGDDGAGKEGEDTNGKSGDGGTECPSKTKVKYPGVYSSMMTFLGGGRACIGFKFAEMEMKQILATLLPSIHFSLPHTPISADGTPSPHGSESPKEIYWNMSSLQSPVVLPPAGDGHTPQLPLCLRPVREDDFRC